MNRFEFSNLFPRVDPASNTHLPVLAHFHEGVMITDDQGIVLYMNAAQTKIDDFSVAEAAVKRVIDAEVSNRAVGHVTF